MSDDFFSSFFSKTRQLLIKLLICNREKIDNDCFCFCFERLQGMSKSVSNTIWRSRWSAVFFLYTPLVFVFFLFLYFFRQFFQIPTSRFSSPFNFSQEKNPNKYERVSWRQSTVFRTNFVLLDFLILFRENEGRNTSIFNQIYDTSLSFTRVYMSVLEVLRLWTRSFQTHMYFCCCCCSAWSNIFLIFLFFLLFLFFVETYISIYKTNKNDSSYRCLSFSLYYFF